MRRSISAWPPEPFSNWGWSSTLLSVTVRHDGIARFRQTTSAATALDLRKPWALPSAYLSNLCCSSDQ
jgi:hypothetical protein